MEPTGDAKDPYEIGGLNSGGIAGYFDKKDDFFFHIPMRDNAYDMALEFAKSVYETNRAKYEERGQSDGYYIVQQIADGKFCELALWKYLRTLNFECGMPDMKVYDSSAKSFGADLVAFKKGAKYQVHCKSQNVHSAKAYGHSYVFQKEDRLTRGIDGHYVAMMFQLNTNEVRFYGFMNSSDLPLCLKELRKEELNYTKAAIYYGELNPERIFYDLSARGLLDKQ